MLTTPLAPFALLLLVHIAYQFRTVPTDGRIDLHILVDDARRLQPGRSRALGFRQGQENARMRSTPSAGSPAVGRAASSTPQLASSAASDA